MKHQMFILRLSLLMCISFLMISCDRINEAINHGTLKGFNHCVEDLKSNYVSNETIKMNCAAEHQKIIKSNEIETFVYLTEIDFARDQKSLGNFFLENNSIKYIVTGYELEVKHYKNFTVGTTKKESEKINCIVTRVYNVEGIETTDPNIPDCEITTFSIEIDGLWIEPMKTKTSAKTINIPWNVHLDFGQDRNFFYSLRKIYGFEIS